MRIIPNRFMKIRLGRIIVLTMLAISCAVVYAADETQEATPGGAELIGEIISYMAQSPAQSEEEFLVAVAKRIDVITRETGVEVCGAFQRDVSGRQLEIELRTNASASFCLLPKRERMADSSELHGLTVHSHVSSNRGFVSLTCFDRGMLSALSNGNETASLLPRSLGDQFSESDYELGPGFLVHSGRLWSQQGRGTRRLIASLDRIADPETAGSALLSLIEATEIRMCHLWGVSGRAAYLH